jgi:predicted HNH restriction endonuclease
MSTFDKYFPIISKIIDEELLKNDSIHRDAIILKLLELPEIIELSSDSLVTNKKHNTPEKAIGNMVDWFSAEITKQSKVSLPWVNKYARRKIRHNGRNIWEYSFSEESFANEITDENISQLSEGSIKQVKVNAYERNPKARTECIAHYGLACSCCGFDFFKIYGEIGQDFIHVHHLTLISEIKKEYHVNPIDDLRPVCPNCHAMIHRKKPPFTIAEIKIMIGKNA